MEQHRIADLLQDGSEVTALARAALLDGGVGVVWEGTTASESLARIYRRRLGLTQRTGQETLGLERAVELLDSHPSPIRLGQVTSPDGQWVYMLFLSADAQSLIACTGVRQSR
ncbi:hypothetical protein AQJ30_17340 [Streptomyces longwoodensis]|uniref:Uncharacterized protein n=1 Tax=Streptomyces longwoodensis TaxID=68231 RepID=A0A124HR52_9ACTN|nr:hypothetical protein [Streptomyces longwoodensis]KUN37422.1 hypothetical protein AQJ30_17340 [Streptomyces longwoodensis]